MFEGMDVDLMKRLRNVARVNDLKNREVLAQPERAFLCSNGCGNTLTVSDGARCRQCVLMERMFAHDAA